MKAIEIMMEEHRNIKIALEILRKYSLKLLKGEEVNLQNFYKIIDFIRNYADKHHHGKEEKMLFNKMVDELGAPAEKLVKFGMLVEHDLGRLYIKDLEEALESLKKGKEDAKLDIIANAIGYCNLLKRHIDKEDGVVYKFAEKNLSKDTLEKLEAECEEFEKEAEKEEIQNKYLKLIEKLNID
ncbi:hemerythrin domain-containing protein [Clostridium polynesiense]|uniref:hemerythrin domain-containing protein n=1 Tax=Clostridium polynesiense TaxID=1325933 RepID=UPI00058CABF2|nr:hemerythrin domain-containing protein [Clostridium polynesiense]